MADLHINPLTVFLQYGFKEMRRTGMQAQGNCVFCGKEDHFYINIESKAWDCKKCGRSGGYKKFLEHVLKCANNDKKVLNILAENRGISPDTLQRYGVCAFNEQWLLPVYSRDGEVMNIKIYDGENFRNTAGCSAAMYGLWLVPDEYNDVYVAEGEWDALALADMDIDEAIIGVPGAGTFKTDCIHYFSGKKVYLLYDNDLAGRNGAVKAAAILSPATSDINVLVWPSGLPDGWDVRDEYKVRGKAALEYLRKLCRQIEPTASSVATVAIEAAAAAGPINGTPLDVQEVYTTYGKWLKLDDVLEHRQKSTDIYDIIFGTILGNRIPGSPVWMYIIAPPGGLKTEPLLSLIGGHGIEIVESVTPAALISGVNFGTGEDPSLLARMNGRIMVIKDLTVLFGLPETEQNEIWSILRGAFDGICGRIFGNGTRREIRAQFGILAAVTPNIEKYNEQLAAVGERFLSWRNWIPECPIVRRGHIKAALNNLLKECNMKEELNRIARAVLSAKYPIPSTPSDAIQEKIISTAQWIAIMRGYVSRDKYRRNITYRPYTEVATRLAKELLKWMMGAAMFRNRPVDKEAEDLLRIVRCIARSSVPNYALQVTKTIYAKGAIPKKDIVLDSEETTDIIIGNLIALGIVEKIVEQNVSYFKLSKLYLQLIKESEVYI